MDHVTTLVEPDGDAIDVPAVLRAEGYQAGPSSTLTRTLLDTFDGLLHDAGLLLELREERAIELHMSGAGVVPATLVVPRAARFASDLPPGPFRARLAAVIGVRALLPVVGVRARNTSFTRVDRRGKVVGRARLSTDASVTSDAVGFPHRFIEVEPMAGYEARHASTVERLVRAGLHAAETGPLVLAAAAAGVDPRGHRGAPDVALHAGDPARRSARR